jgi:hypothetical protein
MPKINLEEMETAMSAENVMQLPVANTPDVGRLTAEAVVRDYAATAERIQEVSSELGKVALRCEALLHELNDTSKVLGEAADRFIERGRKIAEELEISAQNTAAVRSAAKEWVDKVIQTTPN